MGTIARLNTAKKKLAQAEQAMPRAYQNNYTDSINQKLVQLADASLTGSTGVDTDALNAAYQQYRANSVANAQNGAAAAAGTANTLAGGYGADWAKTAANQAAGEQIAGVDNSLSSLRADALQNWKQKMSDTTSVLDDLLGQQSLERSEYDGSVSNAQNWRDYLSGRVDTARQENSDFWNNVWNVVKGVGNAVKTGYDAYQGYYQWDKEFELQKQQYADSLQRTQLSDQISAMEQAQAFKQAGFDDLAAQTLTNTENDRTAQEEPEQETIPLSSITYPSKGDRYGRITIAGTTVDAPVYYGDTNSILNRGVGTYVDSSGAGIPGESKTILMAGHNNTFFNDLQSVEVGDVVTIETHYGTYTYTVERCEVRDYQDTTTYDFTRTDENLILYTCYPFDALGFTPNRYFVYASYTSGPELDADR